MASRHGWVESPIKISFLWNLNPFGGWSLSSSDPKTMLRDMHRPKGCIIFVLSWCTAQSYPILTNSPILIQPWNWNLHPVGQSNTRGFLWIREHLFPCLEVGKMGLFRSTQANLLAQVWADLGRYTIPVIPMLWVSSWVCWCALSVTHHFWRWHGYALWHALFHDNHKAQCAFRKLVSVSIGLGL